MCIYLAKMWEMCIKDKRSKCIKAWTYEVAHVQGMAHRDYKEYRGRVADYKKKNMLELLEGPCTVRQSLKFNPM